MGTIRILLADDHGIVRKGLRFLLERQPDMEVVGEAEDGRAAVRLAEELDPNIVIMDIAMPLLNGIDATAQIVKRNNKIGVIVLSMHSDEGYLVRVLTAGAKGYLLKEDADRDLFFAIEKIRQGKTYVSPNLTEELLDDLVQIGKGEGRPSFEIDPLTTREREVVKLIAEGRSSKEIADLLFISARTVDNHRANIMEKLNLKKAADLVKYAIQKGYI